MYGNSGGDSGAGGAPRPAAMDYGYSGQFAPPPPRVRFDVIGEAWRLFQTQTSSWVLANLIFLLIAGGVATAIYAVFFITYLLPEINAASHGRAPMTEITPALAAWSFGIPLAIGLIAAYFQGGLYRMALKQIRGEKISVADVFSAGDVLGNLLGIALVTGLLGGVVGLICLPINRYGGSFLSGGVGFIIGTFLCLAPVIAVDQHKPVLEALALSFQTIKRDALNAILVYFVLSLVAGLGALACGIGAIFTLPLLPIAVVLIYRDLLLGGAPPPGYPGGPASGPANPWVPQQQPGGYTPPPGAYNPQPGNYPPPAPGQYQPPSAPPPQQ